MTLYLIIAVAAWFVFYPGGSETRADYILGTIHQLRSWEQKAVNGDIIATVLVARLES